MHIRAGCFITTLLITVSGYAAPVDDVTHPAPLDASELIAVDPFVFFTDLEALDPPYTPDEPPEDVGEASSDIAWAVAFKFTCLLGAAIAAHHLCDNEEWWNTHCPHGTFRTYTDRWGLEMSKKYADRKVIYQVSVSCNGLREVACEGAAVGAGEALRELCSLLL